MKFPSSFYEAEVRNGFYISSKMKRSWAAQLEVLEEIDKICKRHNLKYYAAWGTLLATVRHGGFIPWDDDFDIYMKRPDYMTFLKVAKDELPEGYKFLNYFTEPEYDTFLTRLVNRNFISVDEDFRMKYHGFPYISGIDIFPLDYVSCDAKEDKRVAELFKNLNSIANTFDAKEKKPGKWKDIISEVAQLYHYKIDPSKPIRYQIMQIMDLMMSSVSEKDADSLAVMAHWWDIHRFKWPKEYFDNTIDMPYETTTICVPIAYDKILRDVYGEYMKPYRDGGVHNYPFYKGMEDMLHNEHGIDIWPVYNPSISDIKPSRSGDDRYVDKANREIVFMPYKASQWIYLEKAWSIAMQDESVSVYVVPVPYYDVNCLGQMGELHYEAEMFPDYVEIIPFDKYDVAARHPYEIIIQNPYDVYDTSTCIHPYFHTHVLRECTDNLVYIPPFILDEFGQEDKKMQSTMEFFCITPGVVNADKVIVQSDNMRSRYIEKLVERFGDIEREIWEKKIVADRDGLYEGITEYTITEADIPEEWWPLLLKPDGEGKKVLLYAQSISLIVQYKDKYFDKMREVFNLLREAADDIVILWKDDICIENTLKFKYPNLYKRYNDIRSAFINDKFGIYDNSDSFAKAVAISDAYYGDGGPVMGAFMTTKRPTMVQSVEM